MTSQDFVFADVFVCEESIGRLRVRPVLKRGGQGFARPLAQSGEHRSQPPVQARIAKITSCRLFLRPSFHASTRSVEVPENESRQIPMRQPQMWPRNCLKPQHVGNFKSGWAVLLG